MPKRFGKLSPRYRFALNPFPAVRWSRCPRCDKLMHARKFALLIAFDEPTLLTLGKTCRHCTPCEFIIAHQHEIEDELAILRAAHPGHAAGEWFVLGTVDKPTWKKSPRQPASLDELAAHTSDIRYRLVLSDPRRAWISAPGARRGE